MIKLIQHDLTRGQQRTLRSVTRGLPQLQTLRKLMEEVCRLFDRRCRTNTALAKRAKLRRLVRRFQQNGQVLSKLHSPNLDKALTVVGGLGAWRCLSFYGIVFVSRFRAAPGSDRMQPMNSGSHPIRR